MRLLPLTLFVWDGRRHVTPLFIAFEKVLVQPFLLLSNQSFLEGHLRPVDMSLPQLLVFVPSLLVLCKLHFVLLNRHLAFYFDLFLLASQISLVFLHIAT